MLLLPRHASTQGLENGYPPEQTTPDRTGFLLNGAVEAPRVVDLVANPQEMAAREQDIVYAQVKGWNSQTMLPTYSNVAVTEAEALRNLDTYLSEYAEASHAGKPAQTCAHALLHGLRFLGASERRRASMAIAHNWTERLRRSKNQNQRLFIGLTPEESSIQVYQEVREQMKTIASDIDLDGRLVPISAMRLAYASKATKRRIISEGLILVDDWAITASQMSGTAKAVTTHTKLWRLLTGNKVEVHLLSATEKHIRKGIGGLACRAFFRHSYNDSDESASITGSHSDTDYGFKATFLSLPVIGPVYRPKPFLFSTIRAYRPNEGVVNPELFGGEHKIAFDRKAKLLKKINDEILQRKLD